MIRLVICIVSVKSSFGLVSKETVAFQMVGFGVFMKNYVFCWWAEQIFLYLGYCNITHD